MKRKQLYDKSIELIDEYGILLVWPVKGIKNTPLSIWEKLYPRTQMTWDWSADGSDKVAALWHLRRELSESSEVIYTKWFSSKATFFSKELFPAFLTPGISKSLSPEAQRILKVLEDDSPLGTKALKELSGYVLSEDRKLFDKALQELWKNLLIVGYGEADEGGFPSLQVGATKLLFEDLFEEAKGMTVIEARDKALNHLSRHYSGPLLKKLTSAFHPH